MTSYKTCAVPKCRSTTILFPKKLYIHVPRCPKRRKQWLMLAGRDPEYTSDKSTIYFCEDHFNLPNDMLNYTQYSLMGSVGKIRMKQDCLPSKFQCKPDKSIAPPHPQSGVRKRQCLNILHEITSEDPKMPGITSNSGNPIVIKEELNISPEVVYIKSEPVENEDGYESNKCEDRMSIQVELDVVKVEEDSNPQHNGDNSNIPTKPEESQSKDIEKEVPTKEAYILLEDCMKELECNNCYCRNCKTLLPSVDALEIHYTNAHSLLIPIKRYKFGSKTSQEMIKLYKQAIKKEITNNEHNYAKTTDV